MVLEEEEEEAGSSRPQPCPVASTPTHRNMPVTPGADEQSCQPGRIERRTARRSGRVCLGPPASDRLRRGARSTDSLSPPQPPALAGTSQTCEMVPGGTLVHVCHGSNVQVHMLSSIVVEIRAADIVVEVEP